MVRILKVRVMTDNELPKTVYPTEQVFATVEDAREFFKSKYSTEKVIMYYEQR
nr:MAG TPA: hypothetical protein [Caudoviricetes sp.]